MPCYVTGSMEGDAELSRQTEYDERKKAEAMLCAIFRAAKGKVAKSGQTLLDFLIESVDEDECGITQKEIRAWWNKHQIEDRARKRHEAEMAANEAARQSALKKLTPSEKRALGIR